MLQILTEKGEQRLEEERRKRDREECERVEEELLLQSREDQELSAAAAAGHLILKMSSEHQTVDHRNKLLGIDHGTIFVRFRTASRTGRHKLCK